VKVHIQEPCQENWNQMTPQEQGRHCAKCDKVVVDFTNMDNHMILSHFNSNNNTCGRFQHWQLEKELTLPTLHNPWTKCIKNAAFSSFLFGGAITAKSQDTAQVDTVIQTTHVEPIDTVFQPTRVVKGVIHQPEDSIHRLNELQFSIDSFQLSLPVISNELSFDIPDSVIGNSLTIYALSDSTKTELALHIFQNDTTTFELVFDEEWTIQPSVLWEWPGYKNTFSPITTTETWIYGGFTTGFTIMEPPIESTPFNSSSWIHNKVSNPENHVTIDPKTGIGRKNNDSIEELKMQQTSKASKDLVVYNKRK